MIKNPLNPKFQRGFTLIELLVVIAIIAILATMGIASFSGVQKNARDARRKGDINSIASAIEANYGKTTAYQYDALASSMFSSGGIPRDPLNTSSATTDGSCPTVCQYCVFQGSSPQTVGACQDATQKILSSGGQPTGGSTNTNWAVCANLEGSGFICRTNSR